MNKIVICLFFFLSNLYPSDITYEYALSLMKKKEYHKAYNLFLEDASNGNPKSQIMIGRFYLQGNKLINKDYKIALNYFEKASKQKFNEANCYIAYMYANAKGVIQNLGRAHVFAKKEKDKGNKLCIKVWNDYNLHKYPIDNSWKFGYYKPIE